MKHTLAIALTWLSSAAFAATPEENYLTTRDALIAKLNPSAELKAPTDAESKEEEQARAELLKQMRTVIGSLNVKGFSGEPTYNVGSLFKGDLETGILDGLAFTGPGNMRLVVTTKGLADRWIKSPDGLAAKEGEVPPDLPTALRQDDFYTRASSADAAVGNMGALPVTKPAGADFAFAMLTGRRQDLVPVPATEILIGAIVPPRVYVVSVPIAKINVTAACVKLFKDAEKKADKIINDNEKAASKRDDEVVSDEAERMREQGDEAMRKCFAQNLKSSPAFAKLTKQAQDIVDTLVAK
jgi:vacuolar-type H+-ATPase subunit H